MNTLVGGKVRCHPHLLVLTSFILCLVILFLTWLPVSYRFAMYSNAAIRQEQLALQFPSTNQSIDDKCISEVVPRFLHLVWFYNQPSPLRFHHLIAFKAALRFFRPTQIFLWHNTVPIGTYWDECLYLISPPTQLLMMQIEPPNVILERRVSQVQHKSDVVRMQSLLEHGGLYIDFDVVLLRDITPLLCYNFTLGQEEPKRMNNGFILSIPKAEFLQKWYDSYVTFDFRNWGDHSSAVSGRLARAYPSLIHVEYYTIHNPNYHHKDLIYGEGRYFNLTENYAIHLYYRKHKVNYNSKTLKTLNNTLGRIFRFIYQERDHMEDF